MNDVCAMSGACGHRVAAGDEQREVCGVQHRRLVGGLVRSAWRGGALTLGALCLGLVGCAMDGEPVDGTDDPASAASEAPASAKLATDTTDLLTTVDSLSVETTLEQFSVDAATGWVIDRGPLPDAVWTLLPDGGLQRVVDYSTGELPPEDFPITSGVLTVVFRRTAAGQFLFTHTFDAVVTGDVTLNGTRSAAVTFTRVANTPGVIVNSNVTVDLTWTHTDGRTLSVQGNHTSQVTRRFWRRIDRVELTAGTHTVTGSQAPYNSTITTPLVIIPAQGRLPSAGVISVTRSNGPDATVTFTETTPSTRIVQLLVEGILYEIVVPQLPPRGF